MIERMILVLGGVLLAGAVLAKSVSVGDPVAGRKLAGQCRTCHGLDGFARIPIAPHIGGEPAEYLMSQLLAFREGSREHEIMSVIAAGMTDTAIADVSAWYSQHNAQATLIASPDNAPEECVACHAADGISVVEDAPNLAGESVIYIDTQLKAFRNGKRVHDIMSGIAEGLSDDGIRAAASWYSAIELEITPKDQ